MVQEALHNVAKHANASSVLIEMFRDGDLVRLTIEDDGVGITQTPNPARQTFGVSGMRERISTLGGKMTIVSTPGHGTRIEVDAPISSQLAGDRTTMGAELGSGAVAQGA